MLKYSLGAQTSQFLFDWSAPAGVDWVAAANRLPPDPQVWTDGSLVLDKVSGASSAGSGVYARLHAGVILASQRMAYLHLQRAELWEVILTLQASEAVNLGVGK